MKRKIIMVTERRADYSKLKPVLEQIAKSEKLEYYLIVTGTHLLHDHGMTIQHIEKDGYNIFTTFPMYLDSSTTPNSMCKAFAECVDVLSAIIEIIKPDIALVGFDLPSQLALAISAKYHNVMVVHMEGGDKSGSIDDSIRDSISAFSDLHLVSNEAAVQNLVEICKKREDIIIVGSTALDDIVKDNPRISYLMKRYILDNGIVV